MRKREITTTKQPTLKELRTLAKRKGLELVGDGQGRLDCYYNRDGISGISCCAHYATEWCHSGLAKVWAYRALYGALSALPDKPKA